MSSDIFSRQIYKKKIEDNAKQQTKFLATGDLRKSYCAKCRLNTISSSDM